jgi:hypothetical protein
MRAVWTIFTVRGLASRRSFAIRSGQDQAHLVERFQAAGSF